MFQAHGKLLGGMHFAASIQSNDVGIFGQCGKNTRAFVTHRTRGVAAFATHTGLDFQQLQRQPVRQPFLILRKPLRHPSGSAFTDGNQAGFHVFALPFGSNSIT
jgi:hypothetical protein